MSYYKKRNRRKINWKNVYRRTKSGMSIAAKALAIANATKRLLNVEFKSKDTSNTDTVPNSWDSITINAVAQGDLGSERDGNKCKCKSVQIQGLLQINAAATTTNITLALVKWKRPNATALVASDVWADSTTFTMRNKDYMQDYAVLWRRTYNLDADSRKSLTFKMYKKFKGFDMKYNGSSGGVTDQVENGLHFMYISDEATNVPNLTMKARIRYLDN